MPKTTSAAIAILLVLAAAPAVAQETPSSANEEAQPEWTFFATVFGWMAGLDGTIGIGNQAGQSVDATFDDLLNYLDFAMGGHFEARNRSVTLITDVWYTKLGSTRDAQVGNQPVSVDLDLTQWILELSAGYPVSDEFLVLLAGRYYILDTGATSESITGGKSGDVTQSWGDIYIGARYTRRFHKNWFGSVRGDIGTGGSKFAWFGEAAVGYQFTDLLSAAIAWRVLSLDREPDSDGDYFKYDIIQNGLGVALGFSF